MNLKSIVKRLENRLLGEIEDERIIIDDVVEGDEPVTILHLTHRGTFCEEISQEECEKRYGKK